MQYIFRRLNSISHLIIITFYLDLYFIFYFRIFEYFIMLWLAENDEMSLEFMYGAIDKDKKDGVCFIFVCSWK